MAPRLRPEVILPLRTGSTWARSLLLSCCAFIMFVTTVDALRYASQRAPERRVHVVRPAAASCGELCRVVRETERLTRKLEADLARMKALDVPATSPRPR